MLQPNISKHCTAVTNVLKHFWFVSVTVLPDPAYSSSSTCTVMLVQYIGSFSFSVCHPFLLPCIRLLYMSHLQPAVRLTFNLACSSSYMASHSFFSPLAYTFPSQQAHVCIISFGTLCVLSAPRSPSTVSQFFSLFTTIAYSLHKYIEQNISSRNFHSKFIFIFQIVFNELLIIFIIT